MQYQIVHSGVKWKIYSHRKNISSNQLFIDFITKCCFHEIFAKKVWEQMSVLIYHTVKW